MKRLLTILLMSMIAILYLYSTSTEGFTLKDEAQFKIRGYKVSEADYGRIIVTSAVGSYDDVDSGEEIKGELNISSYLPNYFSDSPVIDNTTSQLIFSVRVVGSSSGSYKLTINCEPFVLDSLRNNGAMPENIDAVLKDGDKLQIIDSYFKLGATKFMFLDDKTYPSDDEKYTTASDSMAFSDGKLNTQKPNISLSWQVVEAHNNITWSSRVAMLMAVSSTDYSKAKNGTYTSYVTVQLEVN